jgi:hypothetical protein
VERDLTPVQQVDARLAEALAHPLGDPADHEASINNLLDERLELERDCAE